MTIFIPLGIIASIFQLVVLREFSFSIAKNELAFVVATGLWIIACSLGSIAKLPKKFQELPYSILASLAFSLSICLIHLAKSSIGLKYYEEASLGFVFLLSVITIGPPAFIIGLGFRNFSQKYIHRNPTQRKIYAKFFAFDAAGFFLGGITLTFFYINYTNPLIFSLLPLILLPEIKNGYKKIFTASLIIFATIIFSLSFDSILKKEFANADILANLGSSYGPVIIAEKAGTTTLFSGGSVIATSEDKFANEEFIHMSLSATEPSTYKDILFIGTALSGQVEEISQHRLNSLDCLQINPLITKISQSKFPAKPNDKIHFITNDPRAYLKNSNKQYDAILMNMPAPINFALNRYFTKEFFRLVGIHLKPKGIFSFTIPSKREILSPQFIKFNSSIINAVDKVFVNRLIIPSNSMAIISSNGKKLENDYLLDNFTKINPKTTFFTIYHFKDYLDPAIRSYAENMLNRKITANSDLNPSGFLNYLILEQIKFYPGLKIDFKKMQSTLIVFLLFLGVLATIITYLFKKSGYLLNIGVIGFTSISLNSIIFVLFQIYCGCLYWKLGLLIGLFMFGLSIGAFLINAIKNPPNRLLSGFYLLWVIVILILFLNLKVIGSSSYAESIFYLYALICGFLSGSSYPLFAQSLIKNKFNDKNVARTIYAADLTGAFLGTILSGILLLPFLGVTYSLLVLIFLNAIFALKNLRS